MQQSISHANSSFSLIFESPFHKHSQIDFDPSLKSITAVRHHLNRFFKIIVSFQVSIENILHVLYSILSGIAYIYF